MAKDSDRQMTIPELLEARAKVRQSLDELDALPKWNSPFARYFGPTDKTAHDKLEAILKEIEAELEEQGYKDAEGS